jgi:hypothetical protein
VIFRSGSLAVLLAAAALVAPAAARADGGQPFADPVLDRYLQVATEHWGTPPPTCLAVYSFDDPDPSVASRAEQPGCTMWLDRDYFRAPLRASTSDCAVVVHEMGHLLGHAHSSDPTDMMYPTAPPDGAPGCARFDGRARQARADRAAKRRKARRRAARRREQRAARHKHAARAARVAWRAA